MSDDSPAAGTDDEASRPPEETDGGVPVDADEGATSLLANSRIARYGLAALPIILLVVLVGGLLLFPPFAGVQSGQPLPDVSISHVSLPNDETIVLHVTNSAPEPVTIQQVLVNDAYWDFEVAGGPTLAPLESSTIEIPYHWTPNWDIGTTLVVDGGATFHHTILAPQPSPTVDLDVLWTLAIVGVLVGFIPVVLGMLWFPAMEQLSTRWLHAVLALSIGVLTFLAFDAGFEAFEVAHQIPSAFAGELIVVTGIVGTLLVVQAVSAYFSDGGDVSPLGLAYLVALGIGLHNLAEGLAIGSSFALGRVSLGAFLVIGFMVHNVTEGPAVVAPVAGGDRPSLGHFAALGAIAGLPVVLGGWVGSLAFSPLLGALFLAVGVGAILQVDWDIAKMIRAEGRLGTPLNLVGFLVGFLLMYATDLLVAL